jgi:hypothetical protein
MDVLVEDNLFSFFFDQVRSAREVRGTDVREHTEFYLVSLLTHFGRSPNLFEVNGERVDERPLAIRLLESRRSGSTGNRLRDLKQLADSTLYVLGFFSQSLRRSTVNMRYYAGLAESAYGDLAVITRGRASGVDDSAFSELSHRFGDCVEIISEVAHRGRQEDSDILTLYRQWLETGDEILARRLRGLGIVLDDVEAPGSSGDLH